MSHEVKRTSGIGVANADGNALTAAFRVSNSERRRRTTHSYDRASEDYARRLATFEIMRRQYGDLHKHKPEGDLLDVGCGIGRDVAYFNTHGYDAVGVDASRGMITAAMHAHPRYTFALMDMRMLGFADNSFDVVWMSASLHHVTTMQAERVLVEVSRVLRPGGVVFVGVRMGSGEELRDAGDGSSRYYTYYEGQAMRDMLEKNGFAILETYILPGKTRQRPWLNVFARSTKS